MDFELSDDQKLLVKTVEDFCKKQSPVERVRELREVERGWEEAKWQQMGELGWLGVLFSEDEGGLGGTFVDAGLIIEQLGKTLVMEPYLASVVLGGIAVREAGNSSQKQELLGPMIEGTSSLALAFTEENSRHNPFCIETKAEKSGADYKLSGNKRWVLNGQAADHLIVSARTSGEQGSEAGVSLFAVPKDAKGLSIQNVKCMDSHRAAMVSLDGVTVSADGLLGDEGAAGPALAKTLDLGAAACCAEGSGIMDAVLAMTREYLVEREQFGAKIGSFQALQHRCVDMFVEVQLMKSAAIQAMIKADDDDAQERMRAISATKAQLSNGGGYVVRQGTQLHGGIGVTDEHNIGLYFKRMTILSTLCGDEEYHTQRFAQLPSFVEHVA